MIVFDANDVKELIARFTPEQLRQEISTARKRLKGETEWQMQKYYEDYIQACQLAIFVQWQPRPHKDLTYRETIEDLKQRYDLVEYVGQYVKLRKSGNKHQGLCPFHADRKSESFFVYPNGYHCFGCQKSGTIIDFVMQYHNLDIKQAIERLAS